ncbi:MAG: STAS domain-containing protein [Phycisphaerae bacterium]|nr:STAS domain-containing protein [Phycisphaerae bacterium]
MSIENWSDNVLLVELADDPQFTDDMNSVLETIGVRDNLDVVINLQSVTFVNSSNIAKLLKLRKTLVARSRKLRLCAINTHVWGVFLVMGLDKIFDVYNDVATGLASLHFADK